MYDNEIWNNHHDLFTDENAELNHIAARVMGREMAKIAMRNERLFNRIGEILKTNTSDLINSQMAVIMVSYYQNTVEDNVLLLKELMNGFNV